MDKPLCLALYLFNAQSLAETTSEYGAHVEGWLLIALSEALEADGGWETASLGACHGDMYAGQYPVLCRWLTTGQHAHFRIDSTRVDVAAANRLRAGAMDSDLFAVCVSPLEQNQATRSHAGLVAHLERDHYHGMMTFTGQPDPAYIESSTGLSPGYIQALSASDPWQYRLLLRLGTAPFAGDVGLNLSLIGGLEIRWGRCTGWLASDDALREAGLARDS